MTQIMDLDRVLFGKSWCLYTDSDGFALSKTATDCDFAQSLKCTLVAERGMVELPYINRTVLDILRASQYKVYLIASDNSYSVLVMWHRRL